MLRRTFGIAAIAVLAILMLPGTATYAKTMLAKIQSSAAKAIGASAETVEAAVNGDVLVVLRVNSRMNYATHADRTKEASSIVATVSPMIAKSPELKSVATVRIQYIERGEKGADTKTVESIDFQKTPEGAFKLRES
jgi:hypothetical protein